MGLIYGLLGYGRTGDADPINGLTSREKYLVTSTWAIQRKDTVGNGVKLMMKFLGAHPEYQKLFPFKDVEFEELPENKRFQAHSNNVMYGLSTIVDRLYDTELLVEILAKLGESHVPRGISEQNYWNFKKSIVELFTPIMSKEAVDAWVHLMDWGFAEIIKGAKAISKK